MRTLAEHVVVVAALVFGYQAALAAGSFVGLPEQGMHGAFLGLVGALLLALYRRTK